GRLKGAVVGCGLWILGVGCRWLAVVPEAIYHLLLLLDMAGLSIRLPVVSDALDRIDLFTLVHLCCQRSVALSIIILLLILVMTIAVVIWIAQFESYRNSVSPVFAIVLEFGERTHLSVILHGASLETDVM